MLLLFHSPAAETGSLSRSYSQSTLACSLGELINTGPPESSQLAHPHLDPLYTELLQELAVWAAIGSDLRPSLQHLQSLMPLCLCLSSCSFSDSLPCGRTSEIQLYYPARSRDQPMHQQLPISIQISIEDSLEIAMLSQPIESSRTHKYLN